jgi:glutaredoxin|tara:strand:+ start:454 stop:696 length:243 start_codon:yes stop_codon:yes gene_type:complete
MLKIYSKTNCPHCDSAKRFLESKGIEFEVANIEQDTEAKAFLISEGHRSVPQIYKGTELFVEGGYSALIKLTEDEIKEKL